MGFSLYPAVCFTCILQSSNSDSELPPNKDYKSPLSDGGNISFLGSLKKSVDNFREEATAGSEVNVPTTTLNGASIEL